MSVTIYGRHQGDVIFTEGSDADYDRIPARVVHVLTHDAGIRGADEIAWGGKTYLTGSLEAIRTDLDRNALPELDTCTYRDKWTECHEPAPFNLADARPRCVRHVTEE